VLLNLNLVSFFRSFQRQVTGLCRNPRGFTDRIYFRIQTVSRQGRGLLEGERSRSKWAAQKHHWSVQDSCSNVGIWADPLCCRQQQIRCRKRLIHQTQKVWCARRKDTQTLCRSCDTGIWSAISGDCDLPQALVDLQSQTQIDQGISLGTSVKECSDEHTLTECQCWGHGRKLESGWQNGNHNPRLS